MTNLEKIESAIRSALPELTIYHANEFTIDCDTQPPTLLPVTLLHLLRWLGEIGYGKLDTDFVLKFLGLDDMQLDYSKPFLRDQSEEVINELVKLVV